jgi:hypothetical protein
MALYPHDIKERLMNNLVSQMQQVLKALKEPGNLIVVVGVVVAVPLAYSSIRNQNVQQALAAIVFILTPLAVAQILAGYEGSKTGKKIEQIERHLQGLSPSTNPPLRMRTELDSLGEMAENAKDILIVARTAVAVLRDSDFLVDRINRGTTVRVALVDLKEETTLESLGRSTETSEEGYLADQRGSFALIQRMGENVSNRRQFDKQFQIRVFNYVPTLSFLMVDGDHPNGKIVVEMIPYRVSPLSRPHLLLTAKDHHDWYAYFRSRCEAIWKDAEPWSIL